VARSLLPDPPFRGWIVPIALAACLFASPSAGQAPTPQAPTLHLDVQERVLDNGLTVLVWERPSAGRIGARVFYRVDIAAERPGTVGLTHMLEHYLFMGSHSVGTTDWEAERPFAEAVERIERDITDEKNRNRQCFLQRDVFAEVEADCRTPRLDSLEAALAEAFEAQHEYASGTDFDWIYQPAGGTGLTASTGRDWMKFDIDLPAEALELFMWMERSRVENPVFRFFEPEREVVVDQIRRADNRPDGPFERVLRSMTYDAHPYGWAHWFSDLTRATREDHWEIFYRYFIPQNTILVIVGEVEAEEVFRQAERYWGSWREGRPSPRLRTVEPPPVGQKRLVTEAAAGPSVVIQAPMPAVGHEDAPALEVLARLLGEDRGLLERALVGERGIATSVGASSWLAKYPSHLTIRADATSNDDLAALEASMDSVLAGVAAGEVEASLIEAVVDRMILGMARTLERIGPSAVQIGAMESIYGWRHLNEQPELWAAVTPADLARVVERYLDPDMRTVGVLRRTEAEDEQEVAGGARREAAAGEALEAPGGAVDGLAGRSAGGPGLVPLPGGPVEELVHREAGRAFGWAGPRGGAGPGAAREARSPDAGPGSAREGARASAPTPEDDGAIALAEMPWYAPPWMTDRRPSGFSEPPPVESWEELSPPPAAPPLPHAEDHRVRMAEGYWGFMVADSLLPLVQITALVSAGQAHDPVGREGVAELAARVITQGGTWDLDPDDLEARLRELGASLSVQVGRHHTRIHLLTPPRSAGEGARILGQLIRSPRLDPGVLERERQRDAVRADRALDGAGALLDDLFHRTLFDDDHPLARRPSRASVEDLTSEAVADFHRSYFGPEGVVFAISGRMAEEDVVEGLNAGFLDEGEPKDEDEKEKDEEGSRSEVGPEEGRVSDHGPGDRPVHRTGPALGGGVELPPAGPASASGTSLATEEIRVVTRELSTSRQGHVMLGHVGLDGIPEDHAALEMMNYILSGGAFVSRMMELLRTDTGITSALYGSVEPGMDAPFPYVWRFSGNPETLAWGIRLAVEEIERMRLDGVTEREFEGARTSYLQGLIPASYETSHRTAERFAEYELLGRYLYQSPGYLNYYAGDQAQVEAIRNLTLEEVNEAARRYLRPEELVIAIVGPLEAIRAGASPEDLPFVTESTP